MREVKGGGHRPYAMDEASWIHGNCIWAIALIEPILDSVWNRGLSGVIADIAEMT